MSSVSEKAYIKKAYEPGDETEINRAFNRIFNQNRSLDEWKWKFSPGPDGNLIQLIVDSTTGEVLCQYANIMVPFRVDDRMMNAVQSVDDFCVSRPDLAHGNVYIRLMRYFRLSAMQSDNIAFTFGFPSPRPAKLYLLRKEAEVSVDIPHLGRSADRPFPRLTRWNVVPMHDPSALDALCATTAARYPRNGLRNGEWLMNRYLNRPDHSYHSVAAVKNGRIHAWAVFCPLNGDWIWADLLWDGQDTTALSMLDRWARKQARCVGCGNLSMWLRGDPAAQNALIQLGWEGGPNPLPVVLVGCRYQIGLPEDLFSTLYITRGDSDIV